jgi:2-keto-4-pentenoate hydratase/2-oxohepta-3-ene-1,7-dioic acid hydratase in catechol pathway
MKVGRIRTGQIAEAVTDGVENRDGHAQVLNLADVATHRPELIAFPAAMSCLIRAEVSGLDQARKVAEWALREGEDTWFADECDVDWLTPVQEGNCIAAGRNFQKHRAEGLDRWRAQNMARDFHDLAPQGFAKLSNIMILTRSNIARPADVQSFDYEIEVAAVIGRSISGARESEALHSVFGYTMLNDFSAREWQLLEMKNQMILLGKNFPGFGPLGPWIVIADEVPDPSTLDLELRVNGELRQQSSCADIIFSFPQLTAHCSRMGLEIGDLATSGTPEGVALSRKPDPVPFYLKPGDKVDAIVAQISVLETRIV